MIYLVVLIVILSIVLTQIIGIRSRDKKYLEDIQKRYGKLVDIKENDLNLSLTRGYFDWIKDKLNFYIDDITWNDFNLDEVFRAIGNTGSSVGDEILYKLMREQVFDLDELKRREIVIEYFRNNKELREKICLALKKAGKSESCKIYKHTTEGEVWNYKILWVLGKLPILFLILTWFKPIFLVFTIVSIFVNIIIAQRSFRYNSVRLVDYEYIIKIINLGQYIDSLNIKEVNNAYPKIKKHLERLKMVKRQVFVKVENSIPEAVGLNEIRKLFLLSEVIQIEKIGKELRHNEDSVIEIYKYVGEIESFIAIGSLREYIKFFSKPEFNNSNEIEIKEAYYPLIKEPVDNSVRVDKSILLTGSNASGKSTFLRSLGINIIFAQSFNMTFSSKYKGGFFKVYSSMALKDDLLSKESYYMAESKSLKRIIDAEKGDENIICFIDEILRGTNTIERIAASSEILKYLSKNGYKVIAATHDIELTDILKNYYSNYHFSEKIFENEIVFDYKLYKGKTRTRNAIKILEILGYEEEVIKSAEKSAEEFTLNNKWEII